jgi:6-phosphogluconolactonase
MAHADSNRGAAWRAGLLSRDAPPGLELPLLLDGEFFEDARARVETALSLHFDDGLDVLLLGLGEDGHIASLFPGRPWDGPGPLLRVTDSPKPPSSRLTLSLPFLRTASRAILLATGPSKREALLRLLDGDPALPASHLPDLDVVVGLPLSLSLPGASHERIL